MTSPGTDNSGPDNCSSLVSSFIKIPPDVAQRQRSFDHRPVVTESVAESVAESISAPKKPIKRVSTDHSASGIKSRKIQSTENVDGVLGDVYHLCSRYITGQITDNDDYQRLLLSGVIGADEYFKKVGYELSGISLNHLKRAIQSVNNFFSLMPDELKTEKLWQIAIDRDVTLFPEMPDEFKTEMICKKVISCRLDYLPLTTDAFKEKYISFRSKYLNKCQNSSKLNIFPKKSQTYQLCYDAVFPKAGSFSSNDWRVFPDSFKDAAICKLACENNGSSLEFVPLEFITDDLCKTAVSNYPAAIVYVPENRITETMCDMVFDRTQELGGIPYRLRTEDYCKRIIESKKVEQFIHIPKEFRTKEMYDLFIDSLNEFNIAVLFRDMSDDFFEGWLDSLIRQWEKNSDIFGNVKLTTLVRIIKDYKPLFIPGPHCIRNYRRLFEIIKEKSQTLPVTESYSILKKCIALPALDQEFKLDFLQWFNQPGSHASPLVRESVTLINTQDPLAPEIINECLAELVDISFKACRFSPPEKEQGLALDRFIEDGLQKHPDFEYPQQQPCFDSESTVCHGRTLIVTNTREAFYYKLQRKGEDPSQLTRESLIHEFLSNGKASRLGLKSEIPTAVGLYKLPVDTIPPGLLQQLESLEIQPQGQSAYVLCYCYTLSLNYSVYCWQVEVASCDPYWKALTGMMTACHDLGRWCAMNILHTSTLPAFHDTGSGRRWAPLHCALGKGTTLKDAMCGTFGAWDTTATERPDFRYSGLADLVDYELFGSVESYFLFKDLNALSSPPEALQRLALANYIVEVLLANILLYARLHKKTDSDYCIENQGGIDRLAQFIEAVAESFLAGFTQSYQNPPTLRETLNQSETSYQQWLQRTATEIIYWTTERGRNFARDLDESGYLDRELYPEPSPHKRNYPESFHNCDGNLNLGAKNCTFPLLSLIQGLTKLSSAILMSQHNRQSSQPDDRFGKAGKPPEQLGVGLSMSA